MTIKKYSSYNKTTGYKYDNLTLKQFNSLITVAVRKKILIRLSWDKNKKPAYYAIYAQRKL